MAGERPAASPPAASPTPAAAPTPAPTPPATVPLPEVAEQSQTALTALGSIEAEGRAETGLGFGLQNIINNFVSGVILLFERPVKVGDVIQMGDASGEVRRIGIRASIIRTPEGADLIVPNGNLISNPVTNWTYSDRARAVEVTLTLAAGPDPGRVLELLRATAAAQSTGRDGRNAPQAYITGITAGNLAVMVRGWAEHYEDWTRLRSNLSAALVEALGREGIKLV